MTGFPSRLMRKVWLFNRVPGCQWPGCTAAPTEMHEIVKRAMTECNPTARNLSFAPELCSALCSYHHHAAAHETPGATELLLNVNIELYGREAVKAALDAVQQAMRSHLPIALPGDESHESEGRGRQRAAPG